MTINVDGHDKKPPLRERLGMTGQPTPAGHCSHRELVDALGELIAQLRGIADLWAQHAPKPDDNAPQDGRTYPANGLRTEIRQQADYRRYGPGGRIVGYTPPWEN